ncbi:MAG: TrkA family potassium uptake protein [Caldilineaceae bacterium]|nr:TrkA family potassium uptake protein [Caldilineaceae bacterium]
MSKNLYIVIAGCGRLGSLLANDLSKQGHSVVVIDRDESRFAELSAEFSGFTIVGDATEIEVLRRAKSNQADCFLAATNRDNVNLMLAQVAKTVFQVPIVIARIFDPSHEVVYQQLGIATISPTRLSAQAFQDAITQSGRGQP